MENNIDIDWNWENELLLKTWSNNDLVIDELLKEYYDYKD